MTYKIFCVGKKDIPGDGDDVNVDDSINRWQKHKIYELRRWPKRAIRLRNIHILLKFDVFDCRMIFIFSDIRKQLYLLSDFFISNNNGRYLSSPQFKLFCMIT